MVHNYDSISIHYWMINKLKLEGLELLVYAWVFKNASCYFVEWAFIAESIPLFEGILNRRVTCEMLTQAIKKLDENEFVIAHEEETEIRLNHLVLKELLG